MRIQVERETALWFGPESPVRAASAIAAFGDGWLVAQDDATHAAWLRPGGVTAVRVVEPVEGHDTFGSAEGTKHLKPDFEAAVAVVAGGHDGVLLLGSGSTTARMRASLVTGPDAFTTADLTPVYRRVAEALGLPLERLNLEGAARIGDRLRWFQRGNSAAGVPSAAVDVHLSALLTLLAAGSTARAEPAGQPEPATRAEPAARAGLAEVGRPRRYDLGAVRGVALAVTDAVALSDGRLLVAAAAEDTPNAVDDGPVVGAALALLDDDRVLAVAAVPDGPSGPYKIEGLAVRGPVPGGVSVIAVVDADDPLAASSRLDLRVSW
ncbi:hypothetical protein DMB66_44010 [Actinoplanes sp. ATCC 53533]|uniref:DUF6910 family protein n=1 Tax=Actinoplanes sp. ATCC 53533 TaxID=1288362 RepID=UPI000F79E8CE|nr:hypothetical protein [Actinoplanes sp. ATCC 53533]RSM50008.1 hypothetical protein DMB66_44010 [Actinoplanes sp. ATCC 53533]